MRPGKAAPVILSRSARVEVTTERNALTIADRSHNSVSLVCGAGQCGGVELHACKSE